MSHCGSDREGGISDHSSSEESTMIDTVPTRRLTVSHVNKKLEQFRGEVLGEQQSMMHWLKEQQLIAEKKASEDRIEKEQEQRLMDDKKERRQEEKSRKNDENWSDLRQWREKESARIDECVERLESLSCEVDNVKKKLGSQRDEVKEALSNQTTRMDSVRQQMCEQNHI